MQLQWRTHFRMDALAAGVLLAVLQRAPPAAFERLARRRWLWAAVTAAGVAFLATVGKIGALGSTLGYTVAYLTGAAFLLLLHGAAWVPRARLAHPADGRARPLLLRHLHLARLRRASWRSGRLPGMDYESSGPAAQLAKFGAAIAAGVLTTVLVERPVLRLRDRLVPAAPPQRPAETIPLRRVPERVLERAA